MSTKPNPLIQRLIKPEFINCMDCGRGAELVWHNMTEYTIRPVEVQTATTVVTTPMAMTVYVGDAPDKWVMNYAGFRRIVLCGSCQAKRLPQVLSYFKPLRDNAQTPTQSIQRAKPKDPAPPELDLPWLKNL